MSKISKIYYLKGPVCIVGRSDKCDVHIANDKNVSRQHAEIRLVDQRVLVKDCGTTHGTLLNGAPMEKNVEVEVPDKSILRFGVQNTFGRIRNLRFRFCITRLDKPQKENLRQMLRVIGGDMVKTVESATHVVCKVICATVKLLEALLLQKFIITTAWVQSFATTTSPACEIPPPEAYFPPGNDVVQLRRLDDRSALMREMLIFMLAETDEQYTAVMSLCGGQVTSLRHIVDEHSMIAAARDAMSQHPQRRAVVFVNDWQGPTSKLWMLAKSLNLALLTAGQLASAIFSAETPAPQTTDDFSQRVQSQHMSQMSQQFNMVEQAAIERTTTLVPTQPTPAPVSKPDAALRAMIDKPSKPPASSKETAGNVSSVAPPIVPVQARHKRSTAAPAATKRVESAQNDAEAQAAATTSLPPASPVPPTVRGTEYMETRQDNLIQALERSSSMIAAAAPSEVLPAPTTATNQKSKPSKRKAIQLDDIDTTDIDLTGFTSNDVSIDTGKRPRREETKPTSAMAVSAAPDTDTKDIIDVPSIVYLRKAAPAADGWFASTQATQEDSAQRRLHLSQHTPHEESFPEPNIIECGVRMTPNHSRQVPSAATVRHANDKRRFRKNWVKVSLATHKISAEDMERVFPKETEREIQSRAEYEAQVREHQARDEMFTERFR